MNRQGFQPIPASPKQKTKSTRRRGAVVPVGSLYGLLAAILAVALTVTTVILSNRLKTVVQQRNDGTDTITTLMDENAMLDMTIQELISNQTETVVQNGTASFFLGPPNAFGPAPGSTVYELRMVDLPVHGPVYSLLIGPGSSTNPSDPQPYGDGDFPGVKIWISEFTPALPLIFKPNLFSEASLGNLPGNSNAGVLPASEQAKITIIGDTCPCTIGFSSLDLVGRPLFAGTTHFTGIDCYHDPVITDTQWVIQLGVTSMGTQVGVIFNEPTRFLLPLTTEEGSSSCIGF